MRNMEKKILERRKQFIKQVNDIIADIHYKLTGGKERITLTYESSLGNITFETALSKYRERDLRMKSTTVGPHRDDICFTTDAGLDIRKFGSQGQQRTAALSLKLSEIELVKEELMIRLSCFLTMYCLNWTNIGKTIYWIVSIIYRRS